MGGHGAQLDLLQSRKPDPEPVEIGTVAKQRDMQAAINLCVQSSGLIDKEVYRVIGIDAATFSKIGNRQAYFPACKLISLMDTCGNEVPLIWLAQQRGYELKPLLSTLEQELAHERALRIEAERRADIAVQIMRDTRR